MLRNLFIPHRSVVAGLSAVVAASLLPGTAPAAAAGAPNLVVRSATVDRTRLSEGDTLKVTHVVANSGTGKAAATQTRFYLSPDPAASRAARKSSRTNPRSAPQDIRLIGSSPVKKLSPGRSVTVQTVELTVPVGTAASTYSVLACADDGGRVKEKSETDNCTVAGKPLHVEAAAGSDTLLLQTFADSSWWPADEATNVGFIKNFCKAVYPVKVLSLKEAMRSATSFLEDRVGAGALAKLEKSGLADTAVDAQEVAGAAVVEGTPGLALAALLRAHRLEPKIGTHLVNAAALATSVGLPNEALAFLDAAQTLDVRRPAMGISQQAIALTVRGQALLMTGRQAPAEVMFKAAKAAEPLLSEADAGLATVAACKDDDVKAARFVRQSRQRSQEKDTTPEEDVVRPAPQIDLGFGQVTPMRGFPMAETPAQGVVMRPVYWDIQNGLLDEIDAYNAETDALEQHLRDTDELRTEAEIERRDSIRLLASQVGDDPDLKALKQQIFAKSDQVNDMVTEYFGGGSSTGESVYRDLADAADEACRDADDYSACHLQEMNNTCRPAVSSAHTQWRGLMGEMETLLGEYVATASKRMSGYASNLEDEEAHRLVLLDIQAMESDWYSWLVDSALDWTHYEVLYQDQCVLPLEADVLPPSDPEQVESSGPCPKTIAAMTWVGDLGPAKVKVTCEKVSTEISSEVMPLLHAFAEVTYEFRTGKMTVVAGSKGEGKVGVVEGGFKSGVYVSTDGQGNIKDVGWRVGPSVSVSEGAAEFQAYEDTVDLAFISAPTTGP